MLLLDGVTAEETVVVVETVVVEVEVVVVVVVVVEHVAVPLLLANPRAVDAPRTPLALLPLPLRTLLAKPPLLLLLLLAAVPLPIVGNETGGNSGLTVLTEVPGVTGAVGVGCTQLCCALAVLGSAAFDKLELEGREVMMVAVAVVVVATIWLVTDADVDSCTGG